jgi:hypothetical protein
MQRSGNGIIIGAVSLVVGAFAMYIAEPHFPEAALIFDAWLASRSALLSFPGIVVGVLAIRQGWWHSRHTLTGDFSWFGLSALVAGLGVLGYSVYTVFSTAVHAL